MRDDIDLTAELDEAEAIVLAGDDEPTWRCCGDGSRLR